MRWVEEHSACREIMCGQGLRGVAPVLSLGLHGLLILTCVLAGRAGLEVQELVHPVAYEVALVTLKNAGGTGHSASQLTGVQRVTSPLPAAKPVAKLPEPPKVQTESPAPKPKAAVPEPVVEAPRPIAAKVAEAETPKPSPLPDAVREVRPAAAKGTADPTGGQAAAARGEAGAGSAPGPVAKGPTHPQGLPRGIGDGLGNGELAGGIGEVDVLPRIVRKVEPRYPHGARERGVTGLVSVRFLVDSRGRVKDPRVVSAKPCGVFDDSALAAVKRWRFKAARKKGRPVATWVVLPIRFSLE